VAVSDAAATGGSGRPVFVDDAGRRARIVRPLAVAAGALVVAFILTVGGSLIGAPWVPKLSLRAPDQGGTRLATRPFGAGPVAPDAPRLAAASPSAAALGGWAPGLPLSSGTGSSGSSATSFVPAPGTTVFMPLTATTVAPRSSTTPAATRGLTHKKASTATTTTTTVATLR
jgi:hypothetical protein